MPADAPRYDDPIRATLGALRDRMKGAPVATLRADERLDGQTALVTGANRGLGRAAVAQLAGRGASVVLACRSDASASLDDVRRAGGAPGELRHVDLSDLESVRALADALRDSGARIDRLVLNAGVVPNQSRQSAQGLELQAAVNHLANVHLTDRLIADGVLADDARVIVVSSESHRSAPRPSPRDLEAASRYGVSGVMKRYAETKMWLTCWAFAMERQSAPTFHTICPGPVATDIAREAPAWSRPALGPIMRAFFAAPDEGARPLTHLACARARSAPGRYFHRFEQKPPADAAMDDALGRALLEESRALIERRLA